MSNKNELAVAAVRVLLELVKASALHWEAVFFKITCSPPQANTHEFLVRRGDSLTPLPEIPSYTELLDRVMMDIFDTMLKDTGQRPRVAVITIGKDRHYKLKFDPD